MVRAYSWSSQDVCIEEFYELCDGFGEFSDTSVEFCVEEIVLMDSKMHAIHAWSPKINIF